MKSCPDYKACVFRRITDHCVSETTFDCKIYKELTKMDKYYKSNGLYVEEVTINQIRTDAIRDYESKMNKKLRQTWEFYKKDQANRPKPSFHTAAGIVSLIADMMIDYMNDQDE